MIIFMGVAGGGKSTQGRLLADELGLPWLSTGEFLRMLLSGQERRDMVQGHLLNDQQMIALVNKVFGVIDTQEEFILDGFPRTVPQAEWLLSQVKAGLLSITAIFHVTADEEAVEERLLKRGRPDDNKAAIAERFEEYEQTVVPIVKKFAEAGVTVHEINGDQAVAAVQHDIKQALKG